jgi:hypothetical protein
MGHDNAQTAMARRIQAVDSQSHLSWSPDGKVLAVVGTETRVIQKDGTVIVEPRGIECLDGLTGRRLSFFEMNSSTPWIGEKDVLWLPGQVIVVKNRHISGQTFLRFLNTRTGETVKELTLPLIKDEIESFTTDATGWRWGFASGRSGWRVLSKYAMEESAESSEKRLSAATR